MVVGVRLVRQAEMIAARTGLGQALVGMLLLGVVTSLPGLVASGAAAALGNAELAFANAFGGIAAQTLFLAFADMFYPRANLEHAAASIENLIQAALLPMLLSLVLLSCLAPPMALGHIHVASALLPLLFVFGMKVARASASERSWSPRVTDETALEHAGRGPRAIVSRQLGVRFVLSALLVMVAGAVISIVGAEFSKRFGFSESVAGNYITAIPTSLPELVTAVTAARRGSLNLAVGDIIGGNCFDVLFVAVSDAAFLEGPIYQAVGAQGQVTLVVCLLLNAVLLMGLLRREKHGFANIGFESLAMVIIYAASAGILAFMNT